MIIDKMEKDELTYHVPVLLKESVDEAQGIRDKIRNILFNLSFLW